MNRAFLLCWCGLFFGFSAHAWTLIGSSILGWDRPTLVFSVNLENCTVEDEPLLAAVDRAIALWNSIPTAGMRLSRGTSETSVEDFRNDLAPDAPVILCDPNLETTLPDTNEHLVPGAAVNFNADPNLDYAGILLNAVPNAGANISALSEVELDIMLAHEMGHVLGLGHSRSEDSLMYFNISNKERLLLTEDDRDGFSFLYPANQFERNPFGCGAVHEPTTDRGRGMAFLLSMLLILGLNIGWGRWRYSRKSYC